MTTPSHHARLGEADRQFLQYSESNIRPKPQPSWEWGRLTTLPQLAGYLAFTYHVDHDQAMNMIEAQSSSERQRLPWWRRGIQYGESLQIATGKLEVWIADGMMRSAGSRTFKQLARVVADSPHPPFIWALLIGMGLHPKSEA